MDISGMNFKPLKLKTLDNAPIAGKRVLLRAGYDITLAREGGSWVVPDDQRISATIPTINYLIKKGCSIVIMGGWIGRPKPGIVEEQYKMDPIARRLSMLIGKEVRKLDATVGAEVEAIVSRMKEGEIIMLENTRFLKGETEADPQLARQMARLGQCVVFDAFAQAHRIHASTTGILENHPTTSYAGMLMEKEVHVLTQLLKSPLEPFALVLGGAKVSDKIGMMRNILDKAAIVLIGGALANPFFKAKGINTGGSLLESVFVDEAKGKRVDPVEVAREIIEKTKNTPVPLELVPDNGFTSLRATHRQAGEAFELAKIQLPLDVVVAKKKDGGFNNETIKIEKVNGRKDLCAENEAILDIGQVTQHMYAEIIKRARTIFWNGPMGLFENFDFSSGTKAVAKAIADSNGFSIIGGGDTEAVVTQFHLEGRFGHVSTGGGASLALLAGDELPVMKYLTESSNFNV
jgi:phosphoglycerate kinase